MNGLIYERIILISLLKNGEQRNMSNKRTKAMKNIIIVGSSRAGKTTLAKRLNEELGCFVISLDKLVATFARAGIR